MKNKKIAALFTTFASLSLLAACSNQTTNSSNSVSSTEQSTSTSSVNLEDLELPQLDNEVNENESVVEIVTTEGTITVKLFPELAPKAVENFVTHAKDGYYDGTVFHRVIKDFMIQGGDPEGTGRGGESIWDSPFEDEFSKQLYNIRGALSMANSGPDSNGSQFFIVQNSDDLSDGLAKQFTPERIIEAYKNGGAKHLDGVHTVFGQVIEGMDVVDKIAAMGNSEEPVSIETMNVLQEAK